MHLHITEHKSTGQLRPAVVTNAVRAFVNRDYHYGYFVDEHALFALLTPQQQADYLAAPSDVVLDVPPAVAQSIIDMGITPYTKAQVI